MKVSKYVLVALLAFPIMAHKCGQDKKAVEAELEKEEATKMPSYNEKYAEKMADFPDSLILRLQRSACFGTCPVDVTEIYKSGYLVYTPMIHGVRDSVSAAFVGQDEIEVLLYTAEEIDYFNMDASYDANIPDLPGSRYFVRKGDLAKEVNIVSGTPEQIRPLLNRFSIMLKNIENWKDLSAGE